MSASKKQYRTITHERIEKFENIVINTKDSDIILGQSEDNVCRVVICERRNAPHVVKRVGGNLSIDICDNRKWYQRIFCFGKEGEIKLLLPKNHYNALAVNLERGYVEVPASLSFTNGEINISSGVANLGASISGEMKVCLKSGDIAVSRANIGSLDVSTSKGNVILGETNVSDALIANVDNGVIELKSLSVATADANIGKGSVNMTDFVVAEKLHINGGRGNVSFDRSDANEIFVNLGNGKVCGNLLSDKLFIPSVKVGKKNVPESIDGGRCQVSIGVGKIDLSVK